MHADCGVELHVIDETSGGNVLEAKLYSTREDYLPNVHEGQAIILSNVSVSIFH